MNRTSMLLSSFFLAASFAASSARAANSINITSSKCSGTESIVMGTDLSFSCSGDYSFLGGSINWDSKVSFRAEGALLFNNFSITAHEIEIFSTAAMTFEGQIVTRGDLSTIGAAGTFAINTPLNLIPPVAITLGSGGNVVLTGPAGNPSTGICNNMNCPPPLTGTISIVGPRPNGGTIVVAGGNVQVPAIVTTGLILTAGSGPIALVSSVPEPSAYATLLSGLLLLAGLSSRCKAKD